jgi:signal transduction histidine kinase/DNA-binding NarL/FixJ family response regulator
LLAASFLRAFFVLLAVAGVIAWIMVLGGESRRTAERETERQTGLLMSEIAAHQRTDAALQKAKEVAEAANLAKSRYVTGISHELRTPLNAILGYAQLLEHDQTIPERRRDGIRIIRRSGEHLAGLIEGLLDISKIEAGRIELYRDIVRLPHFLDQLVDMFRLQAQAKGIGFEFTHRGRLPDRVRTDERRLRQILINLLSNAIKFTRLGKVSLRVSCSGDIARFEVEDSGVGIAEDDLARVFEPFQRVENSRMSDEAGVGLGLTITRLLTQIMGGDIAVTSTLGRGSTFIVRLMLSEVGGPGHLAAAEQVAIGYIGDRRRILLADDDPVHRGLMEDVLLPLGFVLLCATDGPECLRIAARMQPELFLLDIAMPGMSGWDLARHLREQGFARTPIVMVSANANELNHALLGNEIHDDVLAKPISLPALLEKIGRLLAVEWTVAPPGPRDIAALPAPRQPPLSPMQLDGLRQLAAIGYVRGLRDQLDLLEREVPEAGVYLATLRGYVAEFRLDAFMAELESGLTLATEPDQGV